MSLWLRAENKMEVVVYYSASPPPLLLKQGSVFYREQSSSVLSWFKSSRISLRLWENAKNVIRPVLSVICLEFEPVLFFSCNLSVFYDKQTVPLKVIICQNTGPYERLEIYLKCRVDCNKWITGSQSSRSCDIVISVGLIYSVTQWES